MIPVRQIQKHHSDTSGKILVLICRYMTAEKTAFVLIPKSWVFLFFFLQIIITKSPRVIARLQQKKKKKKKGKTPVSLMFFVCHSKLKWKQDSVRCQQKRMSNADVEVFFFNTLLELLLLCGSVLQRKCLEKSTVALFSTNGGHKERCGKYNWFHCTRYTIFFYCFMPPKKYCLQD